MKKIFNFSKVFDCRALFLFLIIYSLGLGSCSVGRPNNSGLKKERVTKSYSGGPGKACCWVAGTGYCTTWSVCTDQVGEFDIDDESCC